jgi:hypothetical protein
MIVTSDADKQRFDADPDRDAALKIGVVDFYLCGSESKIFGQCGSGSRVLITRYQKLTEIPAEKKLYIF